MSDNKNYFSRCTCKDSDTDVTAKVILDNISKIHFIPRNIIPKTKRTLDHAHKCLALGGDVSADTKLEEFNRIIRDAKEWFKNNVAELLTVQIQRHKLTYKVLLKDFTQVLSVTLIDIFLLKVEQDNSRNFPGVI